jgi:hypothetical protein
MIYINNKTAYLYGNNVEIQAEFLSVVPPKHFFTELIQLLTTGKPVSESHVAVWMEMSSGITPRKLLCFLY